MVNVQEIDHHTYYKQGLDDDLPPYQGMLPNYKLVNNKLVSNRRYLRESIDEELAYIHLFLMILLLGIVWIFKI